MKSECSNLGPVGSASQDRFGLRARPKKLFAPFFPESRIVERRAKRLTH